MPDSFIDITLSRDHNITTGKVYQQVIAQERRGDYLGKTVQVVPHVTNAIQDWLGMYMGNFDTAAQCSLTLSAERVAAIPVDGSNKTPDGEVQGAQCMYNTASLHYISSVHGGTGRYCWRH